MPKEPTKRELLERIEKLERQVDELRVDRIIDNQDVRGLQKYLTEALERGNRRRGEAEATNV